MDEIKTGDWEFEEPEKPKYDEGELIKSDFEEAEETSGVPVDVFETEEEKVIEKKKEAVKEKETEKEGKKIKLGDFEITAEGEGPKAEAEKVIEEKSKEKGETLEEKLMVILSDFIALSPSIEAAALVSLDGLIMASALPPGAEEDRVAAMSAAILSLGEKAASELGRGDLAQVFVEGNKGYVFLMSTAGKAVLTCLAGKEAKIGLVFYDMKKIAHQLGEIL